MRGRGVESAEGTLFRVQTSISYGFQGYGYTLQINLNYFQKNLKCNQFVTILVYTGYRHWVKLYLFEENVIKIEKQKL